MIRVERENVPFYRFPELSRFPELNHFVSGREGGVSTGGRFSLNLGFMDEDSTGNVLVNRELLANAVGCNLDAFTFGEQKHTTHIEVVDTTKRGKGGKEKESRLPATDGLITREPGICLMVLAADCVPVLLYDPVERVIAAVHAGWRGTVGRIAARAVQRMGEEFHCQPENVVVVHLSDLVVSRWARKSSRQPERDWGIYEGSSRTPGILASITLICGRRTGSNWNKRVYYLPG